jgi:AcrR family transcriptional regulator
MASTRESILAVSRRLFLERGYAAASMREIAEKSGIAKATIYHHFADKKRILLALLENTGVGQKAMLEAIRAQSEPRPRIETAVSEIIRLMPEMAGIVQIVRRELPKGRELSLKTYGKTMEEFRGLIAEAMVKGGQRGLFRPIDAERATTVLMAMIQGSFASAMLGDGRMVSPKARTEAILDVYFNGVLA